MTTCLMINLSAKSICHISNLLKAFCGTTGAAFLERLGAFRGDSGKAIAAHFKKLSVLIIMVDFKNFTFFVIKIIGKSKVHGKLTFQVFLVARKSELSGSEPEKTYIGI